MVEVMNVDDLMDFVAGFKETTLEKRYSCVRCGKAKTCTWRMAVCRECETCLMKTEQKGKSTGRTS